MQTIDWKEATSAYRQAKPATSTLPDRAEQVAIEEKEHQTVLELEQGVQALTTFMKTHGDDAKALLGASEKHITIAVDSDGGGFRTVSFIDRNGLQSVTERAGSMAAAYHAVVLSGVRAMVSKPELVVPCSVTEVVTAAMIHAGKKPEDIVGWLRAELDKIASEAPVIA
jgi:hypothetical protein